MKEKILAALKTAYAKLGLSDKAFDGVASLLEKTVTEEAQIATAVGGDDVKALLTAIQGQVDSFRNKLSDKEKELDDYKEKHPDKKDDQDPDGDQNKEPEWARKLRESNERIEARFKADDDAKRRTETLTEIEGKLKKEISPSSFNQGVFKSTLKGFVLGEKEEIDDAVKRLKGDYDAALKETFGNGPIPGVGFNSYADAKTATESKNKFLREQGLLPQEKK